MGPVMPPSKKPESSGISVSSGLSQCYRGSGFSKALQEDDDLDFSLPDIRLEEGAMEDEELTNLNWLHESKNLLKSFGDSVLRSVSPVQDLDDDTPPSPAHSDMPYDARQNPNCKPPYSFSCLIFMAIEDSPTKRLPVKDIYNWILEHFPYFANAPTGWKNSVRHNLSLNKCFKKVDKERSQSIGKGSLWCIDPEYRQNLIQALKKTPYHPHSNVFNTPPASPQAYQSTSGPPLWPGSTFFKRNGALLQGSTKTLLSQAKARGQVTVVGRPACVCIPGAPLNLPVCEMISWFLLHVSNVYPTKNWVELTAEQRLERNLLSFGKNRTIPCVQDRNFYRCFMKEKISYQSYYCTVSS
ncbi:forkhead box protein N3 isoform X1 [Balaenoptera acutorostrata]|uniref:Forkhead box protein N3 n=2 Tax=Balaenoptera acutorostrata TaxID=9767 RepID=A0ABM3TB08_BALAC|nr:forkhead box protein N3 isoform X1 [Balaenoptera acutorostrata]XP_057399280.1 forkhead box protein N3 isoform X1 [Balaenoptera acutorostrata]XP_057399281.1 forkhead box protein N3 isoform X1 [Balaenoptera acutorostrata]